MIDNDNDPDDDHPSTSSSLALRVPSTSVMLVEFPGYVRGVQAALEVLGGEQALAAAAEGRAKYLTARLRPGDPLSHPLVSSAVREGGGESKRRGLLLRVAKKEKNKRLEAAPDEEELGTSTSTTVTSVAAVVSSGVSFPGLADVQYAGWDARAPRNQAGRLLPAWAGGRGGGGSPFFSSSGSILPGEPLLAVPPVFFASDVAPAPVASAPVAAAAAVAAPAATDEAR